MKKPIQKPNTLDLKSLPPGTSRRLALIAGGGLATLALLFLTTDHPQSAPPRKNTQTTPKAVTLLASATQENRSLATYSSLMHRNLFKPLLSGQPRRVLPGQPANGTLLPQGIDGLSPLPGAKAPAAIAGWSYIGTVTVDGVAYALLQQATSGDSGYYRVGESFSGYEVAAVGPKELVLSQPGGQTVHLQKTSGAPAVASRGGNDGGGEMSDAGAPAEGADGAAGAQSVYGRQGRRGRNRGGQNGGNNFGRNNGGNNFGGNNNAGNGGNTTGGDGAPAADTAPAVAPPAPPEGGGTPPLIVAPFENPA